MAKTNASGCSEAVDFCYPVFNRQATVTVLLSFTALMLSNFILIMRIFNVLLCDATKYI